MSSFIVGMISLLLCLSGRMAALCPSGQISCRSGNRCIDLSYVCRSGEQCSDGSDEDSEICSFWKYEEYYCGGSSFRNSVHGCLTPYQFYQLDGCSSTYDKRICELIKKGKLQLQPEEPPAMALKLSDEFVSLLQQAVNITSVKYPSSPCPVLYSKVGDVCLSFFSPAKIPWAEARQFCLSLMGDLLDVTDIKSFVDLLQYMTMSELTTDYWIGGRFDLDTNSWSWVTDDTPMPLGTPYWATRYSRSCEPRSPPHFSNLSAALIGAPCYNYQQAPSQRKQGWCVALTYEHYYYFIDEECHEKRSPLCLYIDKSSERTQEKTGN